MFVLALSTYQHWQARVSMETVESVECDAAEVRELGRCCMGYAPFTSSCGAIAAPDGKQRARTINNALEAPLVGPRCLSRRPRPRISSRPRVGQGLTYTHRATRRPTLPIAQTLDASSALREYR